MWWPKCTRWYPRPRSWRWRRYILDQLVMHQTLASQASSSKRTNYSKRSGFWLGGVMSRPCARVGRNKRGGGNALADTPGRDPGVGGATSLTSGEAVIPGEAGTIEAMREVDVADGTCKLNANTIFQPSAPKVMGQRHSSTKTIPTRPKKRFP